MLLFTYDRFTRATLIASNVYGGIFIFYGQGSVGFSANHSFLRRDHSIRLTDSVGSCFVHKSDK